MHETRKAAAEAGEYTYRGSPCKRGHAGVRYTLSGACQKCVIDAVEETRLKYRAMLKGAKK